MLGGGGNLEFGEFHTYCTVLLRHGSFVKLMSYVFSGTKKLVLLYLHVPVPPFHTSIIERGCTCASCQNYQEQPFATFYQLH